MLRLLAAITLAVLAACGTSPRPTLSATAIQVTAPVVVSLTATQEPVSGPWYPRYLAAITIHNQTTDPVYLVRQTGVAYPAILVLGDAQGTLIYAWKFGAGHPLPGFVFSISAQEIEPHSTFTTTIDANDPALLTRVEEGKIESGHQYTLKAQVLWRTVPGKFHYGDPNAPADLVAESPLYPITWS